MDDIPWWGWVLFSAVALYAVIASLAIGLVVRYMGRVVEILIRLGSR